jgi:hypothetical protein
LIAMPESNNTHLFLAKINHARLKRSAVIRSVIGWSLLRPRYIFRCTRRGRLPMVRNRMPVNLRGGGGELGNLKP